MYYIYDQLKRLSKIVNRQGDIVKTYEYHYDQR
jgi:hypothetical protein